MAAQLLSSHSRDYWDYDVFLSFRGKDTRKTFTDHLYNALDRVGIRTFRDSEELPKGKTITNELVNAVRGSRIYIVIFSKSYASSKWCLRELAEIVNCCRKNKVHTLYPIFYHVSPSDVRNQTGTFAEAFTRHEKLFRSEAEREMVQRWREALTVAAEYAGWDPRNVADGYEARFIEKIVDELLCEVNPTHLAVSECPIGIDSCVDEVKLLLNLGTSDIRVVGIYGMGGIGKTEIAKAIYNRICNTFEGSSCLLGIQETSKNFNGLVQLQKQLLYDTLRKNVIIDTPYRGINLIKDRLHHKRVLIVLDDVDDLDLVHKLLGNLRWFGLGSRIILTTRDKHLLTQLGVDEKYKVKTLNQSQSLELFSWHAFNMAHPKQDYMKLSISVVKYLEGLPLALKVMGSFLRERSHVEWKNELEKLQQRTNDKIHRILKISFDSLDNYTKDLFLTIACFFIGLDMKCAIKIMEGYGFFPNSGIRTLEQKSLVTTNYKNELRMHNLIQDMGREIVREKTLNFSKNSSILWLHEDVFNVLSKFMVSKVGEDLNFNQPILEDVPLETEVFVNMKNLTMLQINTSSFTEWFKYLSRELRWLWWYRCPLQFIPQNFYLENLEVLNMQQSKIMQIWKGHKILNKLKVLNLSYSEDLVKLPDFSKIPNLEILILEGCTRLVEVHESIGYLKSLVSLNLRECRSLRNLSRSVTKLESLEIADLSYCLKLGKLPEQVGNMMSFIELHANGAVIRHQPFSFGLLGTRNIEFFGYIRESTYSNSSSFSSWIAPKLLIRISLLLASSSRFRSLEELNHSYCNLSEDQFPVDLGSLSSLIILKLTGNNFRKLPHSISGLPKLFDLEIDKCMTLQTISGLPPSLSLLYAKGCTSLEKLPNLSDMEHSVIISLSKCHNLVDLDHLQSLKPLFNVMAALVSPSFFQHRLSKTLVQFHTIFLQSSEVPNWFSHQSMGSSISFYVPSLSEGKIRRLLVCASYQGITHAPNYTSTCGPLLAISIYNKTRGLYQFLHTECPSPLQLASRCLVYQIPITKKYIGGYERYFVPEICYIPLNFLRGCYFYCPEQIRNGMEIGSGDEIEVSIDFHGDIGVHKCGIHVLVDEPNAQTYELENEGYALTDDESSEVDDIRDDYISYCIANTNDHVS